MCTSGSGIISSGEPLSWNLRDSGIEFCIELGFEINLKNSRRGFTWPGTEQK